MRSSQGRDIQIAMAYTPAYTPLGASWAFRVIWGQRRRERHVPAQAR